MTPLRHTLERGSVVFDPYMGLKLRKEGRAGGRNPRVSPKQQ